MGKLPENAGLREMTRFPVVVIAYGNSLRGDDGLAWRVAEELRQRNFPDVEILQIHQLAPEVAENISRCQAVIFVDAAAAAAERGQAGEMRTVEISEQGVGEGLSSPFHHQYSPAALLAVAAQLYGARPRAFIASLVGEDFSPGESLSPEIERALPGFVAHIEKLILELIGARPKSDPKTQNSQM